VTSFFFLEFNTDGEVSDESSSESLAGINVLDSSESVVASAVVDAVLGVGETPGLAGAVRLLNGNLGGDGLVEEELAGEGGLASLVAVGLILAVPGDVASNVNLHVHVHGAALVPSREMVSMVAAPVLSVSWIPRRKVLSSVPEPRKWE